VIGLVIGTKRKRRAALGAGEGAVGVGHATTSG
jgi:hypothetical protein